MPESHQQPYFGYALQKLPKDDQLAHCIAEYLYMRITKNPQLSIGEWKACIDELADVCEIMKTTKSTVKPKVRKINQKPAMSVHDLCYLFMTATKRKWNHIYFTKEQDSVYEQQNFSFYQDPYWQSLKNNPEMRKILEEQLVKCKNDWKD